MRIAAAHAAGEPGIALHIGAALADGYHLGQLRFLLVGRVDLGAVGLRVPVGHLGDPEGLAVLGQAVELAGQAVTNTVRLSTGDGFKFFIADGSWLLVRFSGTEPLVRVYTEATSQAASDACLAAGEALVRG